MSSCCLEAFSQLPSFLFLQGGSLLLCCCSIEEWVGVGVGSAVSKFKHFNPFSY